MFIEWGYLLKEFASDSEDQTYLIEECEIHCSMEKEYNGKFLVILKVLHKNIIKSDKITDWCLFAENKLKYYKNHLEEIKDKVKDMKAYKFEEVDLEEKDEVLEVVGLEKREKNLKSLEKFLKELEESSESSDSEKSDDKNKKKASA